MVSSVSHKADSFDDEDAYGIRVTTTHDITMTVDRDKRGNATKQVATNAFEVADHPKYGTIGEVWETTSVYERDKQGWPTQLTQTVAYSMYQNIGDQNNEGDPQTTAQTHGDEVQDAPGP